MGAPILPRNAEDPQGSDRMERRAMADFYRRMRQVLRLYKDALKATPYKAVTVNVTRYEFELNPAILAMMTEEIDRAVDRILLEGGASSLWFTTFYVEPSYAAGTAAAWRNLGSQAEVYRLSRPELASILQSAPYRERLSYLAARQFENLKGITAETKASMSRILVDGFSQGLNPRDVARTLTEQAGIEARRGHLIARTEIGQALRQARLDESQQAQTELGITSRMMWFSALSPTTRATHMARHGQLYSAQAVREIYSRPGDACNCKCTQIEVLTDDMGKPLNSALVDRVKAMTPR